jgi:hypothetical protein
MLGQRTGDDQGAPGYPAAFITVVIDRPDGTGLHPDDLAARGWRPASHVRPIT